MSETIYEHLRTLSEYAINHGFQPVKVFLGEELYQSVRTAEEDRNGSELQEPWFHSTYLGMDIQGTSFGGKDHISLIMKEL